MTPVPEPKITAVTFHQDNEIWVWGEGLVKKEQPPQEYQNSESTPYQPDESVSQHSTEEQEHAVQPQRPSTQAEELFSAPAESVRSAVYTQLSGSSDPHSDYESDGRSALLGTDTPARLSAEEPLHNAGRSQANITHPSGERHQRKASQTHANIWLCEVLPDGELYFPTEDDGRVVDQPRLLPCRASFYADPAGYHTHEDRLVLELPKDTVKRISKKSSGDLLLTAHCPDCSPYSYQQPVPESPFGATELQDGEPKLIIKCDDSMQQASVVHATLADVQHASRDLPCAAMTAVLAAGQSSLAKQMLGTSFEAHYGNPKNQAQAWKDLPQGVQAASATISNPNLTYAEDTQQFIALDMPGMNQGIKALKLATQLLAMSLQVARVIIIELEMKFCSTSQIQSLSALALALKVYLMDEGRLARNRKLRTKLLFVYHNCGEDVVAGEPLIRQKLTDDLVNDLKQGLELAAPELGPFEPFPFQTHCVFLPRLPEGASLGEGALLKLRYALWEFLRPVKGVPDKNPMDRLPAAWARMQEHPILQALPSEAALSNTLDSKQVQQADAFRPSHAQQNCSNQGKSNTSTAPQAGSMPATIQHICGWLQKVVQSLPTWGSQIWCTAVRHLGFSF